VRIAVVGAGALGGAFAAGFIRAGRDVVLIDVAAPLVAAINERGLTVESAGERTHVAARATTDPACVGAVELVTVFVKAHDTAGAARTLAPLVGPGTVIATLQNGLGAAEVLAEHHPRTAVVSGVTYHAATLLEPGLVRHSVGPTHAGPRMRATLADAELLAGACAAAGWPARVVADVAPAVWRKLLMNSTNAVAALTGMPGAAEIAEPHVRGLLRDVMAETLAVAHALGHTELELDECVREMEDVLDRAGEGRASMLADMDAGRRTEVDAINGAVVRAAERAGVDVPLNRALLALVKGWERMHGHV
jgi:2-dehydropantoate 2-reductase